MNARETQKIVQGRGPAGFTLVELVLTLGILSGVLLAGTKLMMNQIHTNVESQAQGAREDFRRFIREGLDCDEVIRTEEAKCKSGSYIEAKRWDGKPLFPSDRSEVFGSGGAKTRVPVVAGTNVAVRVRCKEERKGFYTLNFEARRTDSPRLASLADYTEERWSPIFRLVQPVCKKPPPPAPKKPPPKKKKRILPPRPPACFPAWGKILYQDPFSNLGTVNAYLKAKGLQTVGGGQALRSDYYTALAVCQAMGYNQVQYYDCYSSAYQGRCNFKSPGDNQHLVFNGYNLSTVSAHGGGWMATLFCLRTCP